MAARGVFYYGSNAKDAVKKLQSVAQRVMQAEALLNEADKISREAGVPFNYSYASSDAIDSMAQSADWVNSTCNGGSQSEGWKHIPGTPKEKDYERTEDGYVIEDDGDY